MFSPREEVNLQLAPFVPSSSEVIRQMFILAELKPGEIVYDLGAGDGRVVIVAAQEFGAKAIGVEVRGDLVERALKTISELKLEGEVRIIHDDLFRVDVSPADIIILYLTTSANEKIRPKLELKLKPGTRVVSHNYEMPGWKPYKTVKVQTLHHYSRPVYVYRR